jgi:hypothetical protein
VSTTSPARRSWLVPCVEIVTVGLPFCAFKAFTGLILLRVSPLAPLGYLLMALGAIDLLLNTINLMAWLSARRAVSGVCLADVVARRLGLTGRHADLGLAVDVCLSFALVALVIGLGLLAQLPGWALASWNVAVVLNVLGAGIGRLVTAQRT